MFIGLDAFGTYGNMFFNHRLYHLNYDKLEMKGGLIDQIYVDKDINIPYTTEKPDNWTYNTVLNAKFQNNLEGGSVGADGFQIEKIRFQKRRWDELEWQDVAEIKYMPNETLLYEAIDKYVANNFIYQYSIVPITSSIIGNRVVSDEIEAKFNGIFISDKNSNYKLLYDIEISEIENNVGSGLFQPINSQYPIVTYSDLDYDSFSITSTFISAETTTKNGDVDIRMERLGKDRLLKFMKNGKPKVYRDHHGSLKLVTVMGNPKEIPYNNIKGIAKLSFQLVEIGNMDDETLKRYGMLEGLSGVF